MQAFKSCLRHSIYFLVPFGLFLLCAESVLFLNSKDAIHLSINRHYSAFGDMVMPFVTLAADGFTIAVLVFLLMGWNRKFGVITGCAVLLASGVTQLLKHTVFSGEPRPKLFFMNTNAPIRFVPEVENYLFDSFPSGHTTAAFAFYFCLVFAIKNNYLKSALFLFALLIGYSRVYLSQHFLNDVLFGSLIGTVTSFAVMTFAVRKAYWYLPQSEL